MKRTEQEKIELVRMLMENAVNVSRMNEPTVTLTREEAAFIKNLMIDLEHTMMSAKSLKGIDKSFIDKSFTDKFFIDYLFMIEKIIDKFDRV